MIISLKQLWNNSETVSVLYFCFVSDVCASEIKLK